MRKTFAYLSCILSLTLFMCVSVADKELEELSDKLKHRHEEGRSGPGSGPCYVGKWGVATCNGQKTEILQFNSDGSGYLSLPDCNSICQDLRFPFNYTLSGNAITLNYTTPPPVTCVGYGSQRPDKPRNDVLTFTCSGAKLTTTSSGSKTYSRM
jgi:hypothetical protein